MTDAVPHSALMPVHKPKGPRLLRQHPRAMTGAVYAVGSLLLVTPLGIFGASGDSGRFMIFALTVGACAFTSGSIFGPLFKQKCRTPVGAILSAFYGFLSGFLAQLATMAISTIGFELFFPTDTASRVDLLFRVRQAIDASLVFVTPFIAPTGPILGFILYSLQTPKHPQPELLGCHTHHRISTANEGTEK